MPRIIAYAYDADTHCPRCTAELFGLAGGCRAEAVDEHGVYAGSVDREGNRVGAVFTTDEWCNLEGYGCTLACTDCGAVMAEHAPSVHGFCDCGDGCDADDCGSCADRDDDDDDDDASGCSCDECGAVWVPGADELVDPDPRTCYVDPVPGALMHTSVVHTEPAPAPVVRDTSVCYATHMPESAWPCIALDTCPRVADAPAERCAACNVRGYTYATGLCVHCARDASESRAREHRLALPA